MLVWNGVHRVALTKGHLRTGIDAGAPLGPGARFVEMPPTGHQQNRSTTGARRHDRRMLKPNSATRPQVLSVAEFS